jgi:hypothetical protein
VKADADAREIRFTIGAVSKAAARKLEMAGLVDYLNLDIENTA